MNTNNYVIYNRQTGDVLMTIKTEDPMILLLNTPPECDSLRTDMENFGAIKSVDVTTRKLRVKS